MKKIRYYKKKRDGKKVWFSESWGEPLNVVLPNGKILRFACEFYRGDGWYITDTATGFLAQNKNLPNKTELSKYVKDENFLNALERITSREYYKKCEIELNEYKKQFI